VSSQLISIIHFAPGSRALLAPSAPSSQLFLNMYLPGGMIPENVHSYSLQHTHAHDLQPSAENLLTPSLFITFITRFPFSEPGKGVSVILSYFTNIM